MTRKKIFRFLISILFISFGLLSCTEVYTPDISVSKDLIYIDGGITNEPGPYKIILRYAAPYDQKAEFLPVSGAVIRLVENNKTEYMFSETSSGTYLTDEYGPRGVPGNSYKLIIETADGEIYESTEQVMPVANQAVISVYGLLETRKIKYYNVYGEFVLQEEEVGTVYSSVPSADANVYYRFKTSLVLEIISGIIVFPNTGNAKNLPLFMWQTYSHDDLSLLEVNNNISGISKYPLTYTKDDKESFSQLKNKYFTAIKSDYDKRILDTVQVSVETDTGIYVYDSIVYGIPIALHQDDYYTGWILHISQYSITRDAYTFWTDVRKLEETEGELFDPIATQLRGNMKCLTNANKPMFGLFEVASKIITPAFINYDSYYGNFPGKMLDSYILISKNGWVDSIPPPFWVQKIVE